ncbi:MAG: carboxypeptidase regulatory-like domain-containing protein [Candidatus Omnitrophota bacterium]|nr:carboxypeptidase regulatory-like domain-containing protein [Candidatus Omnitrophota bacterium]
MKRIVPWCSAAWMIGVGVAAWGPPAVAADGATVSGSVTFSGPAPARQPVNFGAEKQCALMHGTPPLNDEVVVNPDGTLRGVVVFVAGEVAGTYAPPTEPVVVDQHGCLFLPRIVAAMVGQPIEFRNDDPVLHNVRAMSKKRQSFNIAQPIQGMKTVKMFKEPELAVPIKCDVHFWMVGSLHIFSHPFFAVTGDGGAFTLKGLPAGTYTLEAWHEKLGTQTQTITVQEGGPTQVTLTFSTPAS